ncbi:nuclear transport factor 2 family protein [Kitasatospora sp. NPDC097605]|uniref:nuclear transport factor 2 family protein n=1 Tax=Kitasatospora sp. NPDC097605 TaxID=3157226 RepID=UPI003329246B
MSLNPQHAQIGTGFVQRYYAAFDGDESARAGLADFYSDGKSLVTIEGDQITGRQSIVRRIENLGFQKIQRIITSTDTQPTGDGGVLIVVAGQIRTTDEPAQPFHDTFVLKPAEESFFVEHHVFRLGQPA